ncbi:MAG: hypothetical protein NWF11_00135, partial [Candidatus Bathyarchaeota archaeon]|nr:hypothetical protein [Candidatus Bathyarchaeota archaeon]
KWIMRRLPVEKGFTFFHGFARPTNITASSLPEFLEGLKRVAIQSVEYHVERGDFERWISQVLGDRKLAEKIASIGQEDLSGKRRRKKLIAVTGARIKQLETMAATVEV